MSYRGELPLPDQVAELHKKVEEAESKLKDHDRSINNLAQKKVINVDFGNVKHLVFGTLVTIVVGGTLMGVVHSCNVNTTERESSARRYADRAEQRQHEAEEARNQREFEAAQASMTAQDEVCTRACEALSATVIRPAPCMCGRNGSLFVFNEDLTTLTHVQQVESLVAPGRATRIQAPPNPAADPPDTSDTAAEP